MQDTVTDRKATKAEVLAKASAIRRLAINLGLQRVRVRGDGALVVRSEERGYRATNRLSSQAGELLGVYVHVITDDVPGAAGATEL
ncbi:MAG: hypothetical protein JJE52_13810 [Acidimicrobiia bacterium]|nr:hypothetical protein [Acidimicrobiia bacterium]